MTHAIVENDKVINIIEYDGGELLLPPGQELIDPAGQPVGIGYGYDPETGAFTGPREPEALAFPGAGDPAYGEAELAEVRALTDKSGLFSRLRALFTQ